MRRLSWSAAAVVLVFCTPDARTEPPTAKRRTDATEEDLRKQLLAVPDVGLSQATAATLYAEVEAAEKKKGSAIRPDIGGAFYTGVVNKAGGAGLPWVKGLDATKGQEDAQALHVLSIGLREALMKATPRGDVRPDPDKVKELLAKGEGPKPAEWKKAAAVPTLMQLLQAENAPVRELLIGMLADIDGPQATAALAQRAVFELSPEVRQKAVQALAGRPLREAWPALAEALRHPWPPAADHAAEAIAALGATDRTPDLVALLREPDPRAPTKGEKGGGVVRELVRVNHLANCMVCHAPSQAKADLVRGRVPSPGESPPPLYYRDTRGTFVRADVTYLRQEFSVMQSVPVPGKWPSHQRYDYLVRTRAASAAELRTGTRPRTDLDGPAAPSAIYPQRDAVLFALRQLTKADAGATYDQWASYLKGRK